MIALKSNAALTCNLFFAFIQRIVGRGPSHFRSLFTIQFVVLNDTNTIQVTSYVALNWMERKSNFQLNLWKTIRNFKSPHLPLVFCRFRRETRPSYSIPLDILFRNEIIRSSFVFCEQNWVEMRNCWIQTHWSTKRFIAHLHNSFLIELVGSVINGFWCCSSGCWCRCPSGRCWCCCCLLAIVSCTAMSTTQTKHTE